MRSAPSRARGVRPLRSTLVQGRHGQTGECSAEVHQDGGIWIACPESRGLVIWAQLPRRREDFSGGFTAAYQSLPVGHDGARLVTGMPGERTKGNACKVKREVQRDKLFHPEGNQGQEHAARGCCVTPTLGGFHSKTSLHQPEGSDNEA